MLRKLKGLLSRQSNTEAKVWPVKGHGCWRFEILIIQNLDLLHRVFSESKNVSLLLNAAIPLFYTRPVTTPNVNLTNYLQSSL